MEVHYYVSARTVSFYLREDQIRAIAQRASRERISQSALIRLAVDHLLGLQPPPKSGRKPTKAFQSRLPAISENGVEIPFDSQS